MHKSKAVLTPLGQHFKLSREQSLQSDEAKVEMESVPYSSVVGSLMYAMICSRPDLAYAISVVSIFMSNSGVQH